MLASLRDFHEQSVPTGAARCMPLIQSVWDDANLHCHASGKPMRQWRDSCTGHGHGNNVRVRVRCRTGGAAPNAASDSLEYVRVWLRELLADGVEVRDSDDFYHVLTQRQADVAKGAWRVNFEARCTQTGRKVLKRKGTRARKRRLHAKQRMPRSSLHYTHGACPAWSDYELRTMDIRACVIAFQLTSGNRAPEAARKAGPFPMAVSYEVVACLCPTPDQLRDGAHRGGDRDPRRR